MGGEQGARQGRVREAEPPGFLEKQILFPLGAKADPLCSRKKGQGEGADSPRGPRNPLLDC